MDDEMTADEFDAAYAAGEDVELVGDPVVVVGDVTSLAKWGGASSTFAANVVVTPTIGRDYSPRLQRTETTVGAVAGVA